MTAKEKLLKEAPDWTEEQAARALRAAEVEDFDQWLNDLPEDDERLSSEEEAAIDEADAEIAAGQGSSLEDAKRELGIE